MVDSHIPPTEFQSSVNATLQRKMEHALSGCSDQESDSLGDPTGIMAELPPFPARRNDPCILTKQAWYSTWRREKRAEKKKNQPGIPRYSLSKKHTKPQDVLVHFNTKNLQAAKEAFVSQWQACKEPKEYTLEELVVEGFRVIDWDEQ